MSQLKDLLEKAGNLKNLFSLNGRKALVVGGNKGLGQAMALALAAAGADVAVAGRGPAGLAETAEAVASLGRKGEYLAADASDPNEVKRMFAAVNDRLGGLDILVNSQGTVHLQEAIDFDMEQWDRVMNVNLRSLVLTCKEAGRLMLAKGYGKIINISSVRSLQGRVNDLAYAPSKAAVNQLTHSLAIEWGPKGINVNAIAPCFVRTEISAAYLDDPAKRAWVMSRIPMGCYSVPEDMFGAVVFLASDASRFINGHLLMIDGGWTVA
ncbi:MAG: glucose 1-dehydrogenase [Planctomycetota bacterium]|jgi:2-deoxy-D-gluconate 3-dehydrogenase|nr:glucose 1-dehydrogenase [Planctomycetota bacterium]